jgi:hypothetical protein
VGFAREERRLRRGSLGRLEFSLLDPQLRRDLGIVATHFLDEPLRVLEPDEHLEPDTEREVGRESVVDDWYTVRPCGIDMRVR